MNRSKQSIKNSAISITSYITKLVINFVVRTIFIHKLGAEYLGLNSLFSNILTLLSLADLGFSSAIGFAMYKPIAENNIEKVKSLLSFFKKIYLIVGIIIIAVGLCLTPFLDYLIAGKPNVDVDIRIVYVVFVLNSGLSYFFAHRKTLIFAYQRNDVEVLINTGAMLLLYVLQIIALCLFSNYYIYIALMPVCTVFELVIVWVASRRLFPEIYGKAQILPRDEKKAIIKNVYAMSLHKIATVILLGTDSLLISSILGLEILGKYSNYLLIVTSLLTIVGLLANAFKSSVGNLVATETIERNQSVFHKLNLIVQCITGLFAVCFFVLIQPFMEIWIDANYKMSFFLVALFAGYIYLMGNRHAVQAFKDAKGLFWQNRYAPIIECLLNLGISIGCAIWFGVEGILVGTVVSLIIVPFWVEPFILYKYYFKTGQKTYWLKYALHTLLTIVAGAACFGICWIIPGSGIGIWIAKAIICICITAVVYLLAYFKTPEFKSLLETLKSLKQGKKHKKDNKLVENVQNLSESGENRPRNQQDEEKVDVGEDVEIVES